MATNFHSPIGQSRLAASSHHSPLSLSDIETDSSNLSFLSDYQKKPVPGDHRGRSKGNGQNTMDDLVKSLTRLRAQKALYGASSGWFGKSDTAYRYSNTPNTTVQPQDRLIPPSTATSTAPPLALGLSVGFGSTIHGSGHSAENVNYDSDSDDSDCIPAPNVTRLEQKVKSKLKKRRRMKQKSVKVSIGQPRPPRNAILSPVRSKTKTDPAPRNPHSMSLTTSRILLENESLREGVFDEIRDLGRLHETPKSYGTSNSHRPAISPDRHGCRTCSSFTLNGRQSK